VNEAHLRILSSQEWAETLQVEMLPWVAEAGDLGDDVLELGPGPGLTTDLLRQRVRKLTAVEIDPALATALRDRLAGSNVTVVQTDATCTGLEGAGSRQLCASPCSTTCRRPTFRTTSSVKLGACCAATAGSSASTPSTVRRRESCMPVMFSSPWPLGPSPPAWRWPGLATWPFRPPSAEFGSSPRNLDRRSPRQSGHLGDGAARVPRGRELAHPPSHQSWCRQPSSWAAFEQSKKPSLPLS
jgi:hypothetical protein